MAADEAQEVPAGDYADQAADLDDRQLIAAAAGGFALSLLRRAAQGDG